MMEKENTEMTDITLLQKRAEAYLGCEISAALWKDALEDAKRYPMVEVILGEEEEK